MTRDRLHPPSRPVAAFPARRLGLLGGRGRLAAAVLAAVLILPSATTRAADKSAAEYAADLASSDRALKKEAAYQLSRLGPAARIALPQLIEALGDDQQQVWFGAITALTQLGPDAEPALPALLKELELWQPFRKDRQGAQALYRTALALGSIGKAAVPALSNALSSPQWPVRAGSAKALGFAATHATPVVPRLVQRLDDERAEVRDAVAETLSLIGPPAVPPLADTLARADVPNARAAAASALGRLGTNALVALPTLVAAMTNDAAPAVRVQSVSAFARVARGHPDLVPRLLDAWRGDSPEVRIAARSALLLVRPAERDLLPTLTDDLRNGGTETRTAVAGLLADLGPDARPAIPSLVALLKSAPGSTADPALTRALAAIGPAALGSIFGELEQRTASALPAGDWTLATLRQVDATCAPPLTEALDHPHPAVRVGALEGLTTLGREARTAARKIPALLDDTDPAVRARAWIAAGACSVPPEALMTRLGAGLEDRSIEVRRAAIAGVSLLGSAAAPALPRLVAELDSTDPGIPVAAAKALGSLGPDAADASEALAEHLAPADAPFRSALLDALGRIGPPAARQVDRMGAVAASPEPEVRHAFLEATARFGRTGTNALALVDARLRDPEPSVRAVALKARASVAPESGSTIEALVAALDDPEVAVRRAAAESLVTLGEFGRPAESKLFALLTSPVDRDAARDALRAIHPTTVPRLLEALSHSDWSVREMAADSLARLAKSAEAAIPDLERRVREDPNEDVKRASRRALRRIREG